MHKRLKYLIHIFTIQISSHLVMVNVRVRHPTKCIWYVFWTLWPLQFILQATSYILERAASFCSGYGSTDLLPEGKFKFLIVRSELICR